MTLHFRPWTQFTNLGIRYFAISALDPKPSRIGLLVDVLNAFDCLRNASADQLSIILSLPTSPGSKMELYNQLMKRLPLESWIR